MTMWRQLLTAVLISTIAVPTWSESRAVGNVVSGQFATVRNVPLYSGSTIFNGDAIVVGATGNVQVAVSDGGRVAVFANSAVHMTRDASTTELVVDSGSASFSTEAHEMLTAAIADATVRPLDGSVLASILMESSSSALVIAKRGALGISTAHDGRTLVVPEGATARVALIPAPQSSGPRSAGKSALPSVNGKMIAIGAIIVGGVTAAAVGYVVSQSKHVTVVSPSSPN